MFRTPMLCKALPTATALIGAAAVICLLVNSPFLRTAHSGSFKNWHNSFGISEATTTTTAEQPEVHSSIDSRLGDADGVDLVKESSRALWTAGVPGDGLLLAVANSDEDAVAWEGVESSEGQEADQGGSLKHVRSWHKPLQPLNKWDFATVVLAALGLMVAAAGGIGGGGILVPIYILVLKFSPKYAVPLSNITIFGGAITNTILNMRKRHPLANRPLVDWDLILVMEPLTIGGALVGSFVQKVLPELLLTMLMIVFLLATADRTLRKGVKTFKNETKQQKQGLAVVSSGNGTSASAASKSGGGFVAGDALLGNASAAKGSYGAAENGKGTFTPAVLLAPRESVHSAPGDEEDAQMIPMTVPNSPDSTDDADVGVVKLKDLLDEEKSTPFAKVGILTAVFTVLLTVNLLKGGGGFESPVGIECGSVSFWAIAFLSLAYLLAVSFRVREYLVRRWRLKARLGYQYVEGDVEWNPLNTLRYPAICIFAGFFAGMFGVGGGIVKGPLMLEMGVHPQVASSTSAVMILYTSFTATTSFIVFGLLKVDYAIPLFFLGLVATAVGQAGTDYMVRKFKRPSFIILSVGSVVALSAALMGSDALNDLVSRDAGGAEGTGGLCSAGA